MSSPLLKHDLPLFKSRMNHEDCSNRKREHIL